MIKKGCWIIIIAAGLYYLSSDNPSPIDPNSKKLGLIYPDEEDSYLSQHHSSVSRFHSLGGSYTVEACNSRTGRCYELEAEINDGQVDRIYFAGGGHLDLDGAELDDDGHAVGESFTVREGYDGDEWEIDCSDCE